MADAFDDEFNKLFGGDTLDTTPAPPPAQSFEAAFDTLFADTTALDEATETVQGEALKHGAVISESTATRLASEGIAAYHTLPKPLRALLGVHDAEADKFRKRAENLIEQTGGRLAFASARLFEATTGKALRKYLEHKSPDAMARLAETMPEHMTLHEDEVPSAAAHDQLDDAAAMDAVGTNWLDTEPDYMERMSAHMDAEKEHVVRKYGGDWKAYETALANMSLGERLGHRAGLLTRDLAMPDPLMFIGAPLKLLKVAGRSVKAVDQAIAARKIGESFADVRGAEQTIEAVHGRFGPLIKHADDLESKLDKMEDMKGSPAYDKLHKRLLEARAEIDSRISEGAPGEPRIYAGPRLRPQAVFVPMKEMPAEEVIKRQRAADDIIPAADVEAAIKAEGYSDTAHLMDEADRAFNALATNKPGGEKILSDLERMPEAVKEHLDALGVSRRRILEAAALASGKAEDISKHTDLARPEIAASRAFMGPDDVEEAGSALAHMRDGGNPAHTPIHGVAAPEHSVINQGDVVKADGVWLRDAPDYRKKNVGGLRDMSRRDAFTHLLGRQSTPSLAKGAYHIDAGSVTRAANNVGRRLAFAATKIMPINLANYIPEVAKIHKLAHDNYRLHVNDSEDILRSALLRSGMVKQHKDRSLSAADKGGLDRVIDLLDTEVDEATGTSQALESLIGKSSDKEVELYKTLRTWLDAQAEQLGPHMRGKPISGYFPHYFPEYDRKQGMRALEYLGTNRLAHTSFFALRERTGAEGWSRDLINTLDIYNRGAQRKIVMEPAYQRIAKEIETMRAAGRNDEANLAEAFLKDSRGMADPSVFARTASALGMSEKAQRTVEAVVSNATSLIYKSMLGGNLNYGLQNMAGGTTNMAAAHGPFHLMQGLLQFATPEWRKIAMESGALKQAEHTLENLPAGTFKAIKDAYKVMDVGQRTETVLRGVAVLTALSEQVSRSGRSWKELRAAGMESEMIREAVRLADRTQHTFGPLGRNPYWHSILGHTTYSAVSQLGTYPWKQAEFLFTGMKEDPGLIVKYLAFSGMAARIAAEQFGVALAPSVGFSFADPLRAPRNQRAVPYAPIPELLASTVDMFTAWREGDPVEIEKMTDRWKRAATASTFGLNQIERNARNLRESLAGKKEKFFERAPLREVGGQLLRGEPGLGRTERGKPAIEEVEREMGGGERMIHALGIRTIEDQVAINERKTAKREKFAKKREKMERKKQRAAALRDKERMLSDFTFAIRRGDGAEMHRAYEKLRENGFDLSADGKRAASEAEFLRWRLRVLRAAPGFLNGDE